MSKAEQEVLKTFKNGFGLTSAEREILTNYIDKQQRNINKLINYIAVRENKDYEEVRKEFDI